MAEAHRDLTNYQWRLVANAIESCSLPIFVKLVFAEICRWRSYTKPQETHLAATVMDSIMMLFERIEKQVCRVPNRLAFCAILSLTTTMIVPARTNSSFPRFGLYYGSQKWSLRIRAGRFDFFRRSSS